MYGNQQPIGMVNMQGVHFQQQQQRQQQAAAMSIPHYSAAVQAGSAGAYYGAAQHAVQQPQVVNPQFTAYHPADATAQPQQAGYPDAGVAVSASANYTESPSPLIATNPNLALSLYDLPAPTAVGSLPPAAPPEMDVLGQLMAVALQHRCEEMKAFERSHQSIFHSSRVPGISVWDYIRRIAKYSSCSPECFITALVLLDRYSHRTRVPLSFRNVHRLSITAVMVSAKLRDDIYYSNAYYSSIGGVSCKELSHLELELLSTVEWNTWVEPSQFYEYVERLRMLYGTLLPPVQC